MTMVLSSLVVSIGSARPVDGVDLTLAPGTSTALVGASGAGKSLTCAALAGTLPRGARATGALVEDGVDLLPLPAARRPAGARIALVQQDPSTALHPLMRVVDQAALAARGAGRSRRGAVARALELLAAVGLDAELAERVPARLSGGQRQRAAIALALSCDPAVLIADEPTTALDVVARAELLDVLGSVASGATLVPNSSDGAARGSDDAPAAPALLLVTHDLPAAAICERIVVMDAGRVVERGPAARVLAHPDHPVTAAMCEAAREETLAGARAAASAHDLDTDPGARAALRSEKTPVLAGARR